MRAPAAQYNSLKLTSIETNSLSLHQQGNRAEYGNEIMKIEDLSTPAFLVDHKILKENCERMLRKAKREKIRIRPHVKTHKCLEAARYQLGLHGTSWIFFNFIFYLHGCTN